MDKLFGTHWQTSLFGYLGALMLYVEQALTSGTALPTTAGGWLHLGAGAAVAAMGRVAADARPVAPPS